MNTARQAQMIEAADIINKSRTGCTAEVSEGVVIVQVPGIGYINGKTQIFYSTENVYSVRGARALLATME